MGKTIYHYCSVETLKCILKNKTIRLSDLRKSNDPKEVEFLFDEYKKVFREKHGKDIGFSFDYFVKEQLHNTFYLGTCFSRECDSIHMWTSYGNEGVAIGFDVAKINEATNHICFNAGPDYEKYPNFSKPSRFEDIHYLNSTEAKAYLLREYKFETTDLFFSDLHKLIQESPFYKSSFFRIEKEMRLAVCLITDSLKTNSLAITDENHMQKRVSILSSSKNRNFDHVMVCDVPFIPNAIVSITIGPNCKLSKNDIEELLLVYGFIDGVDVKLSNGALR